MDEALRLADDLLRRGREAQRLRQAACIHAAGVELGDKMKGCEVIGESCLAYEGVAMDRAQCVAGLYFTYKIIETAPLSPVVPYTFAAAAAHCLGREYSIVTSKIRCEEKMDECRVVVLSRHKEVVTACQQP
jgi:hypothetical protein